jgi:hypothetical protein
MYGWNDKAAKADPKHYIGGEKPAAVYEIGQYEVTVAGATPESEPEVTYRHKYRHTSDPRSVLPNMEIADGEIRIPVTDLVGEALKRLDPLDLAKALWQNDDVRREFMDCLVSQYNEQGIEDKDRRDFLRGVKEAVHSEMLDALAGSMGKLEYDVSKRSYFYHEVSGVNDALRQRELELRERFGTEDINLPRLRHEDHDPDFKIGGKHWNEARDHWREEVAKRFPGA